jgi:hypothetical protein
MRRRTRGAERGEVPKTLMYVVLSLAVGIAASGAGSATVLESASGHGTLESPGTKKRQFSFNAKLHADGTVTGQAQLVNPNFLVGNQPYRLHIDISCMKVVGNIAILGGTTVGTNDPNLVDAVYFTVQDNDEPGRGRDRISRVFFFDDDPNTTGDPDLCLLTGPADFPLEPITGGNIQVRPSGL